MGLKQYIMMSAIWVMAATESIFAESVESDNHGICLSSMNLKAGSPLPRGVLRHRLVMLKEAGCDSVEVSEPSLSKDVLELCDELGLLIQNAALDSSQAEASGEIFSRVTDTDMLSSGFKTPIYYVLRSHWDEEPYIKAVVNPLDGKRDAGLSFFHVDVSGHVQLRDPGLYQPLDRSWNRATEHWNHTPGSMTVVEVFSNCDFAELILNNRSLGRRKISDFPDRIMKWGVPFEAGELTLRGWKNGRLVSESLVTHEEPEAVYMSIEKRHLIADGSDVSLIELQLVDDNGTPVKTFDKELRFSVEDGLKVLDEDNGFQVADRTFDRIVTRNGRALLILQSTKQVGTFKVSVSGNGLQESWILISTQNDAG